MHVKIEIPDYDPVIGFKYKWEDCFKIETIVKNNEIIIKANKEGLVSLARHLLNLAQDAVPKDVHLHLDENNSLEDGSTDLVIVKV